MLPTLIINDPIDIVMNWTQWMCEKLFIIYLVYLLQQSQSEPDSSSSS